MHFSSQRLGALATGILFVANAVKLAAAAEPDPLFNLPVFNNPAGDETAQYAIFQQIARIIDRVPAGQDIEMSWFEFKADYTTDTASKPNLAARLVKAHQRGVNVRIILDNNTKDDGSSNEQLPPYKALEPELGTDDTASSYILLCPDNEGCIGKRMIYTDTYAYNHNKLLLASQVVLNDKSVISNVVFQSSGNLGTWDADESWNNALTWDDPTLYGEFQQYFTDLHANWDGDGDDDYYWVGNTTAEVKPHFFPRKETNGDLDQASTDTVVSILDAVKCSYTGETDGEVHQTDIRIVMWEFNRVSVAEKLVSLVEDGCWVDVTFTLAKDSVKTILGGPGSDKLGLTECAVDYDDRNLRPHSKYMLIDGAYDDDQIPRVFMGSHNYAMSSLRNADETLVRIRSAEVHKAYLDQNFYQVRDTCSGKIEPA